MKSLKKIVNTGKRFAKIILFSGMAFTLGCGINMTEPEVILPEEEKLPQEYVDPNTADVRGTWYKHGATRGWYGPNREWGFAWFYLRQYGSTIEGKYEYELYDQNDYFDELTPVIGSVDSNWVVLYLVRGDTTFFGGGTVNGDTMNLSYKKLVRTSNGIERRATPW